MKIPSFQLVAQAKKSQVILVCFLSRIPHNQHVSKSCGLYYQNVSRTCPLLTIHPLPLVHTAVTSHPDQCNGLPPGLSAPVLAPIQSLLNIATAWSFTSVKSRSLFGLNPPVASHLTQPKRVFKMFTRVLWWLGPSLIFWPHLLLLFPLFSPEETRFVLFLLFSFNKSYKFLHHNVWTSYSPCLETPLALVFALFSPALHQSSLKCYLLKDDFPNHWI